MTVIHYNNNSIEIYLSLESRIPKDVINVFLEMYLEIYVPNVILFYKANVLYFGYYNGIRYKIIEDSNWGAKDGTIFEYLIYTTDHKLLSSVITDPNIIKKKFCDFHDARYTYFGSYIFSDSINDLKSELKQLTIYTKIKSCLIRSGVLHIMVLIECMIYILESCEKLKINNML